MNKLGLNVGGATTFSIMTFSITALSIRIKNTTLSINVK
jgi:hypothetical protein